MWPHQHVVIHKCYEIYYQTYVVSCFSSWVIKYCITTSLLGGGLCWNGSKWKNNEGWKLNWSVQLSLNDNKCKLLWHLNQQRPISTLTSRKTRHGRQGYSCRSEEDQWRHTLLTPGKLAWFNIEAQTKWPIFPRRHFQMHFREWRWVNFD